MKLSPFPADDVLRANAAHEEGISDERTMATPRDGFRAHDRASFLFGESDQSLKPVLKFRSLHIVGEASERSVVPTEVHRIAPRMAQAAQLAQMDVANSPSAQLRGKCLPIELRIVARTRNGAHVNDALNFVRAQ